ncbi:hypothetical protein DL96DRAFT_1811799 [Flagelloscypha sp. PMI_526]|nr:hypothetical protein DL96DRAFT_1811799 [Flagelloscypha sp. PMI_526]
MERRSARIKQSSAASSAKPVAQIPNRNAKTASATTSTKRAVKNERKTKSKSKNREIIESEPPWVGYLVNFLDLMPLDVVLEACSHLTSEDLLNLIRTTKALRALLLDRFGAAGAWKCARANYFPALPHCPDDMSEPEYANLLFDTHCHVCMKSRSHEIIWAARIRCCRECLGEGFMSPTELQYHLEQEYGAGKEVVEGFPLTQVVPGCPMQVENHWSYYRQDIWYYSIEIAEQYLDEYKVAWQNSDPRALSEWLRVKVADIASRQEHAILADEWLLAQRDEKALSNARKKEERGEQIISRLGGLGYEQDIAKLSERQRSELLTLPGARSIKPLTDKDWRSLLPSLRSYLDDARVERQQRERTAVIISRITAMIGALGNVEPKIDSAPRFVDLLGFDPRFKGVLFNFPEDEPEFFADDFQDILQDLPQIVGSWREATDSALLDILRSAKDFEHLEPTKNDLTSPRTLFDCHCGSGHLNLRYDEVLERQCYNSRPWWAYAAYDSRNCSSLDEYALVRQLGLSWTADKLKYCQEFSDLRRTSLELAGFDPASVTWTQVDDKKDMQLCLVEEDHIDRYTQKVKGSLLAIFPLSAALTPHLVDWDLRQALENPKSALALPTNEQLQPLCDKLPFAQCRSCSEVLKADECVTHILGCRYKRSRNICLFLLSSSDPSRNNI